MTPDELKQFKQRAKDCPVYGLGHEAVLNLLAHIEEMEKEAAESMRMKTEIDRVAYDLVGFMQKSDDKKRRAKDEMEEWHSMGMGMAYEIAAEMLTRRVLKRRFNFAKARREIQQDCAALNSKEDGK